MNECYVRLLSGAPQKQKTMRARTRFKSLLPLFFAPSSRASEPQVYAREILLAVAEKNAHVLSTVQRETA